jgi:rfaE bifunctional protein kinase chain/domain
VKRTAARDVLSGLEGKRVLIVGDVMLDEYIWGDVRRISPEAPVPVVELRRRIDVPGGAANTAVNVLCLGGQSLLGGVVGDDPQAERLRQALEQRGVAAEGLVADPQRSTTIKTRIIAHHQQVVRVDHEERGALAPALESELLDWAQGHLTQVDACILSDYAKGVISPRLAERLIRMARQANKPVIVDPKGANYTKYRGATVVKPNVHELAQFFKRELPDEASLLEAGSQLADLLEGTTVLLTCGADGMFVVQPGIAPVHIPSVARDVFDVTGAGDTVVSTLALALAAGMELEHAVHLANRAAGIVVGKVGTASVTLDELAAASVR